MFTGIIEEIGQVVSIEKENDNLHIGVTCSFLKELKIDQSVAHNGVCLTIVKLKTDHYIVTAIKETLEKTNLSNLLVGDFINLERGMKLSDRLDGHIVQGHVDQTGECIFVENKNGSWIYTFKYDNSTGNITIEKGSITVNGVSLTVINSKKDSFSVAVIPYTYENTNLKNIQVGNYINLEFDVIGKYVVKLQQLK
jgi:riboflavin synthase